VSLIENASPTRKLTTRNGNSWFPTMSFQLEFKIKLSALPSYIAPHTFGVWSTGRFLIEGRHEVRTPLSRIVSLCNVFTDY